MNNLPNRITITRILLMPVFIALFLVSFPGSKFVALGIFLIAAISDALDGYIARKYSLVTDLGKFLDPIADKLLATTGLIMLITGANPIIPMPYGIIVMFVMILRDYEVTGLRQIGQLKGRIIAADKVAKIKANFLYFTLVYGLLISALREITINADFMKYFTLVFYFFVGITTCLIALSGIVYLANNISVFKDDKAEEKVAENTDTNKKVTEKKKSTKSKTK
ncbi:MAG TPA: CDP-diacylglycerol--glycerol-3-phosphate 3-phosphatidyltransferase [Clostridiales bacterium]|nr:CDP-diacylglycerol--glycerol-3-phosphate 3-phosphatidyltransferase [Clostridiales bacterium]